MKKISVLLITVIAALSMSATSCNSRKNPTLKTDLDSASYALGILNGRGFNMNLGNLPGDPINVDLLLAGLETGLRGDSVKISYEDAEAFLNDYFQNAQDRKNQQLKNEGVTFLEENKSKSGVITTESGLQYQVLTEGSGARPTEASTVKVHYTGSLIDGTVFDTSFDRGEPSTFGVRQVIQGWQEGLQIMPVGSKYVLWVPAELGYGERGMPPTIPGNAVLKFEVELLEIVQ